MAILHERSDLLGLITMCNGYHDFALRMACFKITDSLRHVA